jgi:hypothetical protein
MEVHGCVAGAAFLVQRWLIVLFDNRNAERNDGTITRTFSMPSPNAKALKWKVGILCVAVAAALLAACPNSPPPIGRGLPRTFGYTPAFAERLKDHFPVGS